MGLPHITPDELRALAAKASQVFDESFSNPWRKAADEIERLLAREIESLRLLNAAFGEYSCCGKAKLDESEVAEFERNFAVSARKFIAET